MKKIWPWLLFLLLLMIFCVWTKKDSIHVNSNTKIKSSTAPVIVDQKHYIDYTLAQKDKGYTLSGNFKNVQQENLLANTIKTTGNHITIKGATTNQTLMGDEAITLTNKILPHFIANYHNGTISYHDQKLKVSGDVNSYEAQHEMQRLLNTSTLPSQEDTNVVLTKPINYTISKEDDIVDITGTLSNDTQIDTLLSKLPSSTTNHVKKDSHYIDNGAIAMTQDILPSFMQKYTNGKIEYNNKTLTVSGMVKTPEDLEEMNKLLSTTREIPIVNRTILDKNFIKKAQEEAQRKQAELDAQKKAQEAKANINKLLKIENIEFNVAKGSLTVKGKATVDKLAKILKQYPDINIEIAGYTDSDGSSEYNQKLSQSRVDTTKDRLISRGIPANRLVAKGYGEANPLVPNTSDANKQKNRRVEIKIQGK